MSEIRKINIITPQNPDQYYKNDRYIQFIHTNVNVLNGPSIDDYMPPIYLEKSKDDATIAFLAMYAIERVYYAKNDEGMNLEYKIKEGQRVANIEVVLPYFKDKSELLSEDRLCLDKANINRLFVYNNYLSILMNDKGYNFVDYKDFDNDKYGVASFNLIEGEPTAKNKYNVVNFTSRFNEIIDEFLNERNQ